MNWKDELNCYIEKKENQEKAEEAYLKEIIPDDQADRLANSLFNEVVENLKRFTGKSYVICENRLLSKYYYQVYLKWSGCSLHFGKDGLSSDKDSNDYYIRYAEGDLNSTLYCRNIESLNKVLSKTKHKLEKEGFIINATYKYGDYNHQEDDNFVVNSTSRRVFCVTKVPCTKEGRIK